MVAEIGDLTDAQWLQFRRPGRNLHHVQLPAARLIPHSHPSHPWGTSSPKLSAAPVVPDRSNAARAVLSPGLRYPSNTRLHVETHLCAPMRGWMDPPTSQGQSQIQSITGHHDAERHVQEQLFNGISGFTNG